MPAGQRIVRIRISISIRTPSSLTRSHTVSYSTHIACLTLVVTLTYYSDSASDCWLSQLIWPFTHIVSTYSTTVLPSTTGYLIECSLLNSSLRLLCWPNGPLSNHTFSSHPHTYSILHFLLYQNRTLSMYVYVNVSKSGIHVKSR